MFYEVYNDTFMEITIFFLSRELLPFPQILSRLFLVMNLLNAVELVFHNAVMDHQPPFTDIS